MHSSRGRHALNGSNGWIEYARYEGPSQSDRKRRLQRRVSGASIAVAAFSTIEEWYDFTLYLYLATVLSRVFFGAGEAALTTTLATFAIAYQLRPARRHGLRPYRRQVWAPANHAAVCGDHDDGGVRHSPAANPRSSGRYCRLAALSPPLSHGTFGRRRV
jgi:hypothetical protein